MTTKKPRERYQNLSKEEKRATIWSWMLQKISQKMKNKNQLSIEKNILEREKISSYNYKKVF